MREEESKKESIESKPHFLPFFFFSPSAFLPPGWAPLAGELPVFFPDPGEAF